jgi:poly(3-hydroxybutyrate) depolymerase
MNSTRTTRIGKQSKLARVVLIVLLPVLTGTAVASDVVSRAAQCSGRDQVYLYYSPDKDHPLPAVVLLHGAGDKPSNMVDAWKGFARRQKIVLLAPELPRDPKFEDAAPRIFRCVVEDAKKFVGIDARRVYLFGNSMGGYLAFDGAMFESNYFAAIAVHANRIADEYASIVTHAERKIPVAIYIGDNDQFFSQDSVRKTRDLLRKAGFPVHYVELENHDHNYYALADDINSDAWKFLKDKRLPE